METYKEDKIQEAQTFPEVKMKKVLAKKTKSEFRSRSMLLFALGFFVGIAVKTEALKTVSIGYNDYLMKIKSQSYDIGDIQLKLRKERETMEQGQEQESIQVEAENIIG